MSRPSLAERPVIWPRQHRGEPVSMLRAAQVHEWPRVIGEVTDALVAFNPGDVLLQSGLHPDAFADPSSPSRLHVATMLLYTADGAVVAVGDANCGYGGTGPHTAHDLLQALGFADANAVFEYRLLHLRPDELVIAERDPVHRISPGMIRLHPVDGTITALAYRADDWPRIDRTYARQRNGEGHEPRDWIEAVLRRHPVPDWAYGETVARCYTSYEATRAAGLAVYGTRGHRHFPLVVEQGRFQLLCPVHPPLSATTVVSEEMLDVLDRLGLGDEARRQNPTSRSQRLWQRARGRPDYLDLPPGMRVYGGDPWRLDDA